MTTRRPTVDAPPPKPPGGKASRSSRAKKPVALTAAQVTAFLTEHPDFLAGNPDLLTRLTVPPRQFDDGRVVDLQAYMLTHHRSRLRDYEQRHDKLVAVTRGNMHAQARIHDAVLAILGARSFNHLLEIVTTDLAVILDVDAIVFGIENGDVGRATAEGVRVLPEGTIDRVMGPGRRVFLQAKVAAADKPVFGAATGLVNSQALLRLAVRHEPPPAILAIGSRDETRFSAGQSSEPFAFLSRVLEHSVRTWLDLPPTQVGPSHQRRV